MPDLPIPIEYRAEVIQPILDLLLSGESCALVGVGSAGKSNIARHLKRQDVREHYLGADEVRTLVVYLNCKPHAHTPPHDFYLYTLDQLQQALEESKSHARVNDLWLDAQAKPERLAKRGLNRGLDRVVSAGIEHIICLMDDCDDLLKFGSPTLFTDLRELRDNHKNQVVYFTITRREPAFLRPEEHSTAIEDFFELLDASGHTFTLPPYTVADGHHMLRRLAARQTPPRPIAENEVRRLYDLGGGHAGLMRTLFFAARAGTDVLNQNILDKLGGNAEVEAECEKIMASLEPDERDDLRRLARGQPPTPEGLHRLQRRGLVPDRVGRDPEIFSPVFERFLRLGPAAEAKPNTGKLPGPTPTPTVPTFQADFSGPGPVRVNGQPIPLVGVDRALLEHLYRHWPDHCSQGDLAGTMRTAEQNELSEFKMRGQPPARLQHYLERLKTKLGPELAAHIQSDDTHYWLS